MPPLVSAPRVQRISFTGSPETARQIGRAAAENIVPFTAELGGKGPLIVFADADLDAAAAKAAGQYDDSGQVCLAGTRLLVEESIRDDFLERFDRHTDAPRARRPARRRDDDLPADPPRPPGPRRGLRRAGPRSTATASSAAAAARRLGGLCYEPTLIEPRVERQRGRPARGVRAGADAADVRRRGRGDRAGQLDPVRAVGDRLHRSSQERAERVGRAVRGGHGVGQHVPRARPDGAVRRHRHLRHRPRGRRLRPRLPQRPQDPPDPSRAPRHERARRSRSTSRTTRSPRASRTRCSAWLRDNDPVRWYDWPHGRGYWAVTRHDDLVAVHKDTATYSSETGATALEDLEQDAIEARKSMLDTDPPRHTRLRALVNRGFTPAGRGGVRDLLRELTTHILDRALPHGGVRLRRRRRRRAADPRAVRDPGRAARRQPAS